MGPTEYFETSGFKIQAPVNRPGQRIRHSEHSEILKYKYAENIYSTLKLLAFLYGSPKDKGSGH
jgi:hypothetical protein